MSRWDERGNGSTLCGARRFFGVARSVLASPAFERVAQSTVTDDGRRSPALRFGDPRVMALLGALCAASNSLGFTNRSLRAQVDQFLGNQAWLGRNKTAPESAFPQVGAGLSGGMA